MIKLSIISVFEKLQIFLPFDFEKKKILTKISNCNEKIKRHDFLINNLKITSKLENVDLSESIEFLENLNNAELKEIENLMKQLELISKK